MSNNVFLKGKNSISNDGLSATSDAFINGATLSNTSPAHIPNNMGFTDFQTSDSNVRQRSATSSAPVPNTVDFADLQTSDVEIRQSINNVLTSDLQLTEELEQRLKKILSEGVMSSEVAPRQSGGTKRYKIKEGRSSGKNTERNKRSIRSYTTDNSSDISVSISGSSNNATFIDTVMHDTSDEDYGEGGEERKVRDNDPLKPHREFVAHIQKVMGVKGGPALQVFAKLYKDLAKKKLPDASSGEQTDKAKELFDNDSSDERDSKYKRALKILEEKKLNKKK